MLMSLLIGKLDTQASVFLSVRKWKFTLVESGYYYMTMTQAYLLDNGCAGVLVAGDVKLPSSRCSEACTELQPPTSSLQPAPAAPHHNTNPPVQYSTVQYSTITPTLHQTFYHPLANTQCRKGICIIST